MARFGEDVDGYSIPVLNEREIRASSGILFLFAFVSLILIITNKDFVLAKYFVLVFFSDFLVRLFISPKYSPTLIVGRLIVRNQVPEYVGAPQKKFAWMIGLGLSASMLVLLNIVNSYSIISGIICLICLIFLFFESAFGICFGCMAYGWIYKEKAQYCPGEVCEVNMKHDIQRTSGKQWMVLLVGLVYVGVLILSLQTLFDIPPELLWSKF